METSNPIESLTSKNLHERCAAARDLSLAGTLDLIPNLVELASRDPSPAVRLCVAGTVADILSRHRVGELAGQLTPEARLDILNLVTAVDPWKNAGMFSMLACVGISEAVSRLAAGLRDPRSGVRMAAGVGLMRCCSSLAFYADEAMEAKIVALLEDDRLKPDARAEVARVSAAVGYTSARVAIERLDLTGRPGELVYEAIELLERSEEPLYGVWESDGRDMGEVNPTPSQPAVTLILSPDGGAFIPSKKGWKWRTKYLKDTPRRMYVRRVGQSEPGPAFQLPGRMFYESPPERVRAIVDELVDAMALTWAPGIAPSNNGGRAAMAVLPVLGDTPADLRCKAILLQASGQAEAALVALEALAEQKHTLADASLFLGDALAARDQAKGAKKAWKRAVKLAKKACPEVADRARKALG